MLKFALFCVLSYYFPIKSAFVFLILPDSNYHTAPLTAKIPNNILPYRRKSGILLQIQKKVVPLQRQKHDALEIR